MTLFEVTREAAREAVQMYFEPITRHFVRPKGDRRELSVLAPAPQPLAESFDRRRKALVVENDPTVRNAFVDVIASSGIDVDWAADGEAAVRYLSRKSYDVLVLDLAVPEVSGTDIVEHLARIQPETNTILVTGVNTSEVRRLFPNVRGALKKPVLSARLLQEVQRCIDTPSTSVPSEKRKQTA